MTREATRTQLLLAQVATALLVIFALLGVFMNGLSAETMDRVFRSIVERPDGPMMFRFILQPVVAAILAVVDGLRDARSGAPAYLWSLLTGSASRADQLMDGIIATSRVILLGLGMDLVYQCLQFSTFYPGEAAIVAVLLAFVPYLLLRGTVARLARRWGVGASSRDGQA
jgi:hypothetical protein